MNALTAVAFFCVVAYASAGLLGPVGLGLGHGLVGVRVAAAPVVANAISHEGQYVASGLERLSDSGAYRPSLNNAGQVLVGAAPVAVGVGHGIGLGHGVGLGGLGLGLGLGLGHL